VILLGDFPSEDDIERGRLFSGTAGKTLDHMLSAAKIDRNECLVTSVFTERPDGNNASAWMRDPAKSQSSFERLAAEFRTKPSNVVVALGPVALWALTGMEALSKVRGSVLAASRVRNGIKVVPTLSPTHVRKQYEMLTVVVGDLVKAKAEDEFPGIRTPVRNLWLDPTLEDLYVLREKMLDAPLLSLDIETGWGQISHMGIAWSKHDAISIPFIDLRQTSKSYWKTAEEEAAAWRFVKEILESPVPKLGQFYANYDALVVLKNLGIKTMNYCEDTYVLSQAVYPELDRNLGFLGAGHSEQGAWKQLGRRQGGEEKNNG
jgi:uracil-DNA glycosylase family 4